MVRNKEYLKEYYKINPWMQSYRAAKARCNNPNNNRYYWYGGRNIKFLLTKEDVKILWFLYKAYEMEKPTIDRIDNDKNYIFTNCRFIEKSLNSQKDKLISILQFDLKGNFIKEWESATKAAKVLNILRESIVQNLIGKNKRARNFIFKYKD